LRDSLNRPPNPNLKPPVPCFNALLEACRVSRQESERAVALARSIGDPKPKLDGFDAGHVVPFRARYPVDRDVLKKESIKVPNTQRIRALTEDEIRKRGPKAQSVIRAIQALSPRAALIFEKLLREQQRSSDSGHQIRVQRSHIELLPDRRNYLLAGETPTAEGKFKHRLEQGPALIWDYADLHSVRPFETRDDEVTDYWRNEWRIHGYRIPHQVPRRIYVGPEDVPFDRPGGELIEGCPVCRKWRVGQDIYTTQESTKEVKWSVEATVQSFPDQKARKKPKPVLIPDRPWRGRIPCVESGYVQRSGVILLVGCCPASRFESFDIGIYDGVRDREVVAVETVNHCDVCDGSSLVSTFTLPKHRVFLGGALAQGHVFTGQIEERDEMYQYAWQSSRPTVRLSRTRITLGPTRYLPEPKASEYAAWLMKAFGKCEYTEEQWQESKWRKTSLWPDGKIEHDDMRLQPYQFFFGEPEWLLSPHRDTDILCADPQNDLFPQTASLTPWADREEVEAELEEMPQDWAEEARHGESLSMSEPQPNLEETSPEEQPKSIRWIGHLTPDEVAAMTLQREGLSLDEIAEQMNVSRRTVVSRLRTAKAKLPA
jgi:predicted DNA-binding protein (UPF0251 family)